MINAVVLIATGVNGDGHREVLGLRVAARADGPRERVLQLTWSPAACPGPAGHLDAHAGLVRRSDEPARCLPAALPDPHAASPMSVTPTRCGRRSGAGDDQPDRGLRPLPDRIGSPGIRGPHDLTLTAGVSLH